MSNRSKRVKQSSKPTKKKSKHGKKLTLTPEQKDRRRKLKASRARKKELAKLLRKKSRQHGPNPYSAIVYHKGYVYEPIRNTYLTASLLSKDKAAMIAARLKTVTTGPEAMTLPDEPGWRTTEIGHNGRLYLVDHCGTEVALFFKRQLTEVMPEPGQKAPEGVLQDPKEAWQRLDLMGRSAEQSNFVLTTAHRRLMEENKLLLERTQDVDDINDQIEKQNVKLHDQVLNLTIQKEAFEKQIRQLKRKPTPPIKKPGKSSGGHGKPHRIARTGKPKRISRRNA